MTMPIDSDLLYVFPRVKKILQDICMNRGIFDMLGKRQQKRFLIRGLPLKSI